MRFHVLCTGIVLLFFSVLSTPAQNSNPRRYSIVGQVIIPPPFFDESFEVVLLQNGAQPAGRVLTGTQGSFSFTNIAPGTYYITVNVPGFQPARQQVVAGGSTRDVLANVMLTPENKSPEATNPINLWGEVENVIDVADLQKQIPAKLVDQLTRANEELKNGKLDQARRRLETAVREAPYFYEARKSLGLAYQRLGRFPEAEVEFSMAHHLRPDSAAPLVSLGSLYIQQVDASTDQDSTAVGTLLTQAVNNLQTAISINPLAAFGYYLLGVANYKLNSYGDAETHLKQALDLEPRLGQVRLALANVYIRTQEWSEALRQLDTYLQENPKASNRNQVAAIRSKIESVLSQATGG